jgi:hypothetical protein
MHGQPDSITLCCWPDLPDLDGIPISWVYVHGPDDGAERYTGCMSRSSLGIRVRVGTGVPWRGHRTFFVSGSLKLRYD